MGCVLHSVFVAIGFVVAAPAQPASNRPENAAVIDAADFPSLQMAINAVPTNGGIVRLPPGDFHLTEPLLISTGEVRLEGSGPATRIINHNANGQPALIIRPRDKAKKNSRIWRVQLDNFRISGNTNSGVLRPI